MSQTPNEAAALRTIAGTQFRIVTIRAAPSGSSTQKAHTQSDLNDTEKFQMELKRGVAEAHKPTGDVVATMFLINSQAYQKAAKVQATQEKQIFTNMAKDLGMADSPVSIRWFPEANRSEGISFLQMPGTVPGDSVFFADHPNLFQVYWMSLPRTGRVVGLFNVYFENDFTELGESLHDFSQYIAHQPAANPATLGMFVLKAMLGRSRGFINWSAQKLRDAQQTAGFHAFTNWQTGSDDSKLTTELTKQVIARTAMMNHYEAAVQGCEDFMDFLLDVNARYWMSMGPEARARDRPGSSGGGGTAARRTIENDMELLARGLAAMKRDVKVWQNTGNLLIQGLQNLIAQRDQSINMKLTQESRRIAEESKRIAEASWKDTTSMTAITIITMMFLPGTFIATLFSIPFFSDLAQGGDRDSQFHIYLGVTIPLTLLVFVIWYGFIWHRERRWARPAGKPSSARRLMQRAFAKSKDSSDDEEKANSDGPAQTV